MRNSDKLSPDLHDLICDVINHFEIVIKVAHDEQQKQANKEYGFWLNEDFNPKIFLVGGAVMDMLHGIEPKDFDMFFVIPNRNVADTLTYSKLKAMPTYAPFVGGLCDAAFKIEGKISSRDVVFDFMSELKSGKTKYGAEKHYSNCHYLAVKQWMSSRFDIDAKMVAYDATGLVLTDLAENAIKTKKADLINTDQIIGKRIYNNDGFTEYYQPFSEREKERLESFRNKMKRFGWN